METSRRKQSTDVKRISFESCCASPRSTLHAFGSSSCSKESRKSVSFAAKGTLVRIIPAAIELTEDDVDALWYTKEEFQLSRKSQMFIVKLMERGMSSLEDDEELCPRGLESRTRAGARRKTRTIEASWDAVLGEQEKQWDEGRFSAWALARIHFEASAQSSMEAFLAAKRDAQYVENLTKRESLEL